LSDGRLCRCPTAAHACDNPKVTKEFLEESKSDIFYDLKEDKSSISEWRKKFPMKACGFCTAWKRSEMERFNDPSYYRKALGKTLVSNLHCKKPRPKVSVVIPSFNYGQYIEEAIQSVLGQTYRDFELILVDYGSSDNTPEIMGKHKLESVVLSIPNRGYPNARNKGIMEAEGEYILCLDADDILSPEFLEEVVKKASAKTIVATWGQKFGENSDVFYVGDVGFTAFWNRNNILSCSLFSKNMWKEVGGYDEEMDQLEDWDFWLRAMVRGYKVDVVKKILVSIRIHGDSVTVAETAYKWKNYMLNKMGCNWGFDEDEYLKSNPDVCDAISSGEIGSAWNHFVLYGCRECRAGIHPDLNAIVSRVVDTIRFQR
jgi:hypothetical protein